MANPHKHKTRWATCPACGRDGVGLLPELTLNETSRRARPPGLRLARHHAPGGGGWCPEAGRPVTAVEVVTRAG